MKSLGLFWRWLRAHEPRRADRVTLRFCMKGGPLSVEAVNPDGTAAAAGSAARVAAWLDHYGFRYATGSSGVWVRS